MSVKHSKKVISTALALTLVISNAAAGTAALAASNNLIRGNASLGLQNANSASINIMEGALAMTTAKDTSKVDAPLVEKYLIEGNFAEGETALTTRLKSEPNDDQARFGLGMLQVLEAIQDLGRGFYKYGLRDFSQHGFVLPFLRMPVPANPKPEKITYEKFRGLFEAFDKKMVQAEATLAGITSPDVKLPLHFGLIRMDLSGVGPKDDSKTLWKLYSQMSRYPDIPAEKAAQFYIKFDRGDVHWLRGYCHVLMSLCDFYLAHDAEETFNRTGHLFFYRVDSPYAFLARGKHLKQFGASESDVFDLVALIHLINWKVVEPQRMEACLHHLEAIIEQSRVSWKFIMQETDDDHEWLPNPKQTGVLPDMKVTDEMVVSWMKIMDECEKILSGKLLLPFWRGDLGMGINLRRVFLEPRTFDLVLWVQGSAAVPYLEKGSMTTRETWRDLRAAFGNRFPGFAMWFN